MLRPDLTLVSAFPRAWCRAALLAALTAASGCNLTAEMNRPLEPTPPANAPITTPTAGGYRQVALAENDTSPQLFLALAVSGGGKRSSAFSYGVFKALRDFSIDFDGRRRSLLAEAKLISGVSGGSFTAAYYGLHRDKMFTDYERDFLKQDIESRIYGTYLLPWNWGWMVSPLYGTNDYMAEIYDRMMFHGATYADLQKRGKPLISVNATDINFGLAFSFTQDYFDLLCSDLSSYRLARAVAASNGFPILFTPITLANHGKNCQRPAPPELHGSLEVQARQRYLLDLARRYHDTERTRYVHLMDGGIADNLALRASINVALMRVLLGDARTLRAAGFHRLRRLLIVVVDGEAINEGPYARDRVVTGLAQILSAVSGTQIDAYNFETLLLAQRAAEEIAAVTRKLRCATAPTIDGHRCSDVKAEVVHLSLHSVPDAAMRERLGKIPTGLTLADADVDALVAAGMEAVRASPELRRFRQGFESPGRRTVAASD